MNLWYYDHAPYIIHANQLTHSCLAFPIYQFYKMLEAAINVLCTYICTILSQASAYFGVNTSPSHTILTVLWYNKILQVSRIFVR